MPKSKRVPRTCLHCGETFLARACKVRVGEARYCSRRCHNEGQRRPVLIICQRCGKEFTIPQCNVGRRTRCRRDCPRPLLPHPTDSSAMLVPLTLGQFAVIDVADAELIGRHNWQARRAKSRYYAQRRDGTGMHNEIMPLPDGLIPDHIDGDGLNNRRGNLRPATYAGNAQNARLRKDNTTGYRGVSLHRRTGKYHATINKRVIATRDTAEEAAHVWDAKARELFGEFARLNFPQEGEQRA